MASSAWSSFHVYLSEPVKVSGFLTQCVLPLAQSLVKERRASRWFFIRYWEGGPHVRLRLQDLSAGDARTVRDALRTAARDWASEHPPTREEYYGSHAFDGKPVDVASLPWYGEGAVVEIAYEPEVQRYGGTLALPINERLFQLSSTISIAVIRSTHAEPARRLSFALALMIGTLLAHDASPESLSSFFEKYAGFWAGYSAQTRQVQATELPRSDDFAASILREIDAQSARLASGAPSRDATALWSVGVKDAAAEWERVYRAGRLVSPLTGAVARDDTAFEAAVRNMLSSQVHMMNNRLGIVPAQEVFLSRTLTTAAAMMRAQRDRAAVLAS